MADSTAGNLFNFISATPSGIMLRTTGAADYSQGGKIIGTKLIKGEFYHIAGVTKNNGTPESRDVYLIDARNPNIIIEKQTSGSDGAFDFKYLLKGNYTVFAVNPDNSQDDVIHANIAAVAM